MLTRNILIICTLAVLLVEGDLEANDGGVQAMSTDKDSTSDEAPTESMNAISPDLPNDEPQYYAGAPAPAADTSSTSVETSPDASAANVVPGAGAAAANSVEDDDDDDDDSDEGGRKKAAPRASKPQPPPPQQPRPPQPPALPPQPIVPQPKAVSTRSKAPSKRRSRTNRRHI